MRSWLSKFRFLAGLAGSAALVLAFAASPAQAQLRILGGQKCCPPPCQTPETVTPAPSVLPPSPADPAPVTPPTIPQEQFAATGTDTFAADMPTVIGDFQKPTGFAALRSGSFKIAENESARPLDRVFIGYTYFNNIGSDAHREVAGFEKTFADGNASFGLRAPAFQTAAPAGYFSQISGFGDMTFIGKYVMWNNRDTGSLFSGGMAMTAPTGSGINLGNGSPDIHPWIFQPWVGYILNGERFYVQGFTSLAMPTDWRDIIFVFNDIAAGWWMYRAGPDSDRTLTGIVPTFELHINDPLNHRVNGDLFRTHDWLVATLGAHIVFNHKSFLTVGAGVPFTGPQVYDYEIGAQFNYRF